MWIESAPIALDQIVVMTTEKSYLLQAKNEPQWKIWFPKKLVKPSQSDPNLIKLVLNKTFNYEIFQDQRDEFGSFQNIEKTTCNYEKILQLFN